MPLRQHLNESGKRRNGATTIALMAFWLGVALGVVGALTSFYPGYEVPWFAVTAIFLVCGHFVPKYKYRIAGLVLGTACIWLALDGYARGITFQEARKIQEKPTLPSADERYAQIEGVIANFNGDPDEYSKYYRQIFSIADSDLLPRLMNHKNDSIAIQSAWESVERTVPVELGETPFTPNRGELNSFLDFLVKRVDAPILDWWRNLILNSRANQRYNIYCFDNYAQPFYHNTDLHLVRCPVNASLERKADDIVYRVKDKSILIPNEVLKRDSGQLFNLSGAFTSDRFYVTVHGSGGHPHTVSCFNRETLDVIWQSVAFGCYMGFTSGKHYSWVELVPQDDDRLFVFGFACTGMYMEAFNSETGESLFHFSTGY